MTDAPRSSPALHLAALAALATAIASCGDDGGGARGGGGPGGGATGSTATGEQPTSGGPSAGGGPGEGGGDASGTAGAGGAAEGAGGSAAQGGGLPAGPVIVGGDRPVEVFVPASYDGDPTPLVILLHGYTASGAIQDGYFQMRALAEEMGFFYAAPDGQVDQTGNRFWNATDACCDFYGAGVDDVAYLRAVIDDASAALHVDARRVFVMGHSNGGFMSHRMACEHADVVAAIASLAGATLDDPEACTPSEPVAALQIHGTADATILFEGGALAGDPYPGAEETARSWAAHGGCDEAPEELDDRDLDAGIAGDETRVSAWTGCAPGGGAALWAIEGGAHVPALAPDFTRQVVAWLLEHPKP